MAQRQAGFSSGPNRLLKLGSLALLCAFGLVAFFIQTRPADAQRSAAPGLRHAGEFQVAHHVKKRRRYYRRYSRKKRKAPAKPAWYTDATEKDPVQLIVSLPDQKVTVYQGDKPLVTSRVSTGRKGYTTPSGVFSILQKKRHHRSNIYGGASMPFMQRLTWSGVALHASNSVPNRPASHGCIRLPPSFAGQLFRFTEEGAHVIVARGKTSPSEIVHDKLFQPSPPAAKDFDLVEIERGLASAGVKLAQEESSTLPIRILVTRRTGRERLADVQRLLNTLDFGAGDVDGWMGPDTAKAIKRFQRTYAEAYDLEADGQMSEALVAALHKVAGKPAPANGHIYVRRNFRQLFDAPANIREPEKLLGQHILTAMHFEHGAQQTRWLVVTLSPGAPKPQREAAAKTENTATDAAPIELPGPQSGDARQALDRIEIPGDIRQRIEELLTPGSSLAISDDGLSKETFPKGTDFVLLNE